MSETKSTNNKILGRMEDPLYRKMPELSQSDLCFIDKSPRHFELRAELMKKETDAMRLGTLLHMAVLEPRRFKESFILEPKTTSTGEELNKRSSKHREWLEKWHQDNVDKVVVKDIEMAKITGMLNEMARSPDLQALFVGGTTECVGTWEYRGIKCKGKADVFMSESPHGRLITELKQTSKSARPSEFTRQVYNYNYHVQSAWYTEGFKADRHVTVVIEEHYPFAIGIYDSFHWIEHGRKKMDGLIDRLIDCKTKNDWPSYTKGIELLLPPTWMAAMGGEDELVAV